MCDPKQRSFSWIGKAGAGVFSVDGKFDGEWKNYIHVNHMPNNTQTFRIYNYGNCRRDFTYVDDIVEGIVRVMRKAPEKKNGEDGLHIPPYAVYNIGCGQPENLLDFVKILKEELVRASVQPED